MSDCEVCGKPLGDHTAQESKECADWLYRGALRVMRRYSDEFIGNVSRALFEVAHGDET